MFYTWAEVSEFLHITPFEILLFLIAVLISTLLLTIKLITETLFPFLSWWTVLSPLFIFDILSAYFGIIVFIRQYQTGAFRKAFVRAILPFKRFFLLVLLKMLLCYKIEENLPFNYSEVFLPLFYLIFILICRAFRIRL